MILSAHQPAYIPWPGYIHKIICSDKFVILDDVQFEKNSFINRNYLLFNKEPGLLTVPIKIKNHTSLKIKDITISDQSSWKRKHLQSLYLNYKNTPFYKKHIQFFEYVYNQNWVFINSINNEILNYILKEVESETVIIKHSDIGVSGSKTELLINLCKKFNCDSFILGANGRDYVDIELGKKENINFFYQIFDTEKFYNYHTYKFSKNISILDLLFNMESSKVKGYLLESGKISKIR